MFVFIDESGIHKATGHSTIALVCVKIVVNKTLEEKILQIENDLKIKAFHWSEFASRRGWGIREKFIRKVINIDFALKVSVIKNPINFSKYFPTAVASLIGKEKIEQIVIDGKKPRWYVKQMKKILRDRGVTVRKVRIVSARGSAGLRLADAMAGLIRSHYDKATPMTKKLYKIIENKIVVIK